MTNGESSPLATPLDEQLVAYLDGELDPESGRRIEELLATDPEVRRRLQAMERTWELLDELDAAPAGGQFTHTTLEMVAVAARQDVEQTLAEAPRRRRRRLWLLGGSLLAAAAAGFLAVALSVDPNRQVLRDLPVLENFDEYRQIESFKFLEMLRDENLFPAAGDEAARSEPAKAELPVQQRRQYVESMSPNDKERLRGLQERFESLDWEHQQDLRQLHEAIQHAPDAEHLRHVMQHYCDWTKSLPSYSQAELAELGPADRIKWIKKQQEGQTLEAGRRLSGKDVQELWKWMNKCATEHEAQFLETLPEPGRERLAKLSPELRHREFIRAMWLPGPAAGAGKPPLLTDDDLARLLPALSPEMRNRLEKLKPPDQWRTVANWTRRALLQRGATRFMRGRLSRDDDESLAKFDESLAKFFEEALSPKERDRLMNLPGEDMRGELLRLYSRRTRSPEGAGSRFEGQKGKRPGGKWPPPKLEKQPPPDAP